MPTQPQVRLVTEDEVYGDVKQIYDGTKAKMGAVPKWMKVMAHRGEVLGGFFGLFQALMNQGTLKSDFKWKIAYRVSEVNKCDLCVSISKKMLTMFGLKEDQMQNLEASMTSAEKLALEYAEAVTVAAYKIDPELMTELKKHYSDAQLVELTSVIGFYNYINRFNDALRVLPD